MASPINNSFYPNKSNCVSTIWKLFNFNYVMIFFYTMQKCPCKKCAIIDTSMTTKIDMCIFCHSFHHSIHPFHSWKKITNPSECQCGFFCVPPKLDKSVYLRKCPIAILISRQIRLPFWELHVAQKKVIEYSHIIVKKKHIFKRGNPYFLPLLSWYVCMI